MRADLPLRRGAPGFTIIEMVVVMAIAAVLMAVVIPSLATFMRNAELTSATNTLMGAINAARGEAMKRGMNAVVAPMAGTDWNSGWRVFVDVDRTNDYTEGTDVLLSQQASPSDRGLSVTGSALLKFDASGYAKDNLNGFAASAMLIQRTDTAEFGQMRRIKIAQTGRTRSCKPASANDPDCDDQPD